MQSLEKAPVVLFGNISIGASGAPTINAVKSQGILSVTRTAAGAYTLALGGPAGIDTYQRLVSASFSFIGASAAASTVCSVSITADSSANATAPSVAIICSDFAGAAVDPASGEVMLPQLTFSNTTAI